MGWAIPPIASGLIVGHPELAAFGHVGIGFRFSPILVVSFPLRILSLSSSVLEILVAIGVPDSLYSGEAWWLVAI